MTKKKENLELKKELGTPVPSCTELGTDELGTRIDAISQQLGTREYAASVAGISADQLVGYIKGRNKPAFLPLVRMALAAGASLDWLATGEEARAGPCPSGGYVNVETLQQAVEAVEIIGKNAPADRKALAIARVYERLMLAPGQAEMIEVMRLIQAILADTPYIKESKEGGNVDS